MPIKTITFIGGRRQVKKFTSYFKKGILFFPLDFTSKNELLEKHIPCKTPFNDNQNQLRTDTHAKITSCMDALITQINKIYGENSPENQYLSITQDALAKLLFYIFLNQSIASKVLDDYKESEIIIGCDDDCNPAGTLQQIIIETAKAKNRSVQIFSLNPLILFKEKIVNFIIKSKFNVSDFFMVPLTGYFPWLLKILQKMQCSRRKTKKSISESNNKKKIVIMPGEYTEYLKMLLPLMRGLQPRYQLIPILFDNLFNETSSILKKNNFTWNNYEIYMDKQLEKEVFSLKARYNLAKNNILGILKEILKERAPLSWKAINLALEKMFMKSIFYKIPLFQIATSQIIEKEKPDLITLPDDVSILSRIAIFEAKKSGIKTLLIPTIFSDPILKETPLWSMKLVCGDFQRSEAIAKGIPADKIAVTGSPKFDALFRKTSFMKKEEMRRIFKIPADKKIFLFTMQSFNDNDGLINMLGKVMQEFQDSCMIIRPHPIQSDIIYKFIVKKLKLNNLVVSKLIDLYDLINSADLVISISSVTIIEAILLNKPAIVLDSNDAGYSISPYQYKAIEYAKDADELSEKIKKTLASPQDREKLENARVNFISQYISTGQSTPKIISVINSLLQ